MQPATRHRIGLAVIAIVIAVIAVLAVAALVDRDDKPAPAPTTTAATRTPSPAPVTPSVSGAAWDPSPPALPEGVSYSYARIDNTNGTLLLGGGVDRHHLDNLLIPGLAEDYLRTLTARGDERTDAVEKQIRDALAGDDDAIEWLTEQVGGSGEAFTRIVKACDLDTTDTAPAKADPMDIARYGACLREGAIADTDSATWVLEQMRATRTGIGESRGDRNLAQQNSTVLVGDQYRAGCLAIGPWWVAAIVVDYDSDRGEPYGRAVCALVSGSVFPPDTEKVPEKKTSPAPSVDVS